ncbi:unnamed protein product [Paramecium sonneborni]|uniref:Uncharacterized protein n=1 Tax=Paramecium sonneborni TaxID=65129 RepID=A0A8S1R993_9CILI|nr:unnamed protein product [Paramecium sonneborni]
MEDLQHTLKYGDNIILRQIGDNKIYYLLARKEQQYLMETNLQINNSCTFNMHNFPQHMVFTIFPKLLYEAQNKFNSDYDQKQLLYNQMETEKKYNQNLLKQSKGQKVIYGNTIMLYQSLSKVFLCRTENNDSNSNIGTNLNSSMYFKIDPDPLAIYIKQGSPVHSYDQFLLIQNDTILKFDTIQEIPRLPEIVQSKNPDHNPEFFTIPAIIENEYQFKFYRAQYKQFATNTREQTSHNTLQAIVLSQQKDINHLHYGQYVRIVEEHQEHRINKGYLISTINAIGCYPAIYLQINRRQNGDSIDKVSSIFQIVPETDQKYSEEIQFNVGNKPNLVGYTQFLLRHLLTGEYLRINPWKWNKLQLSKEINNKYRQMGSNSNKKLNEQPKSVASKNMPGVQLYQNLINQNSNQQNSSQIQQDDPLFKDHQLLFITKLGNNPIIYKDQLPFTTDINFNIVTKNGKCPIEVDSQEQEESYTIQLITKLAMFNQYEEENDEQILNRQLEEEWVQMIPELDQYSKNNKQQQFSQSEKEVLEFIKMEKKIQAKNKVDMKHYKADYQTFQPMFIQLNPFNTQYLDVLASEDFSGSNFKFETVDQSEIEELSEILGLLYPLISLAKNSIQLSTLKFKFSNPKFKESKE